MNRMIAVGMVLLGVSLPLSARAGAAKAAPADKAAPAEKIVPLLNVGDDAPEFTLKLYNPQDAGSAVVSLGNLVGEDAEDPKVKTVLVSFMASWCAPCKKEMPFLQILQERYKDQGLKVLIISIDKEEEGQAKVRELVKANGTTVPVLMDRFNFVAKRWLGEKSPLPSVFLVDRKGKISLAHTGYGEDGSVFLEKAVATSIGVTAKLASEKK